MEIMRKRNSRPITPKKGYDMLLSTSIGNANYKLTNKLKSLSTPRYQSQHRRNQLMKQSGQSTYDSSKNETTSQKEVAESKKFYTQTSQSIKMNKSEN